MTDEIVEAAGFEPEAGDGRRPNPHLLAYDMFKHMTSLSALTLGGMVTLSGSIFADAQGLDNLVLAMGLVAGAGVVAFAGQVEMVDWAHRTKGRPRIIARWGRAIIAMLYGGGVGAFLATVHRTLG